MRIHSFLRLATGVQLQLALVALILTLTLAGGQVRAADPPKPKTDAEKIEALQQRNMELERENAKLRKALETQLEEQRHILRENQSRHSAELKRLVEENVKLKKEAK